MSFKVIDNKLLKKYTKILERINNLICEEFASEPVYGENDKYINTKIIFKKKKIPKKMHHTSACHWQC